MLNHCRTAAAAAVLTASILTSAARAESLPADVDLPVRFVTQLKNAAMALFEQFPNEEVRRASICTLISENTLPEKMTLTAIGRYGRGASIESIQRLSKSLEGVVAHLFDSAFSRLRKSAFTIEPKSREVNGQQAVTLNLAAQNNRSGGRIQFLLEIDANKDLRISDAALDGLRLSLSLRDMVGNIVSQLDQTLTPDQKVLAIGKSLEANNPPCP